VADIIPKVCGFVAGLKAESVLELYKAVQTLRKMLEFLVFGFHGGRLTLYIDNHRKVLHRIITIIGHCHGITKLLSYLNISNYLRHCLNSRIKLVNPKRASLS
jgi:hypothetical protein